MIKKTILLLKTFHSSTLVASLGKLFHLKLLSLGESSPDDLIREPRQFGSIESMRLGTRPVHQLVEEGDVLLGDVLVPFVLNHAGHVGGEDVVDLLGGEVVVMGGE